MLTLTQQAMSRINDATDASLAANFAARFCHQHRFGVIKQSNHQIIVYANMGGSEREEELKSRLEMSAKEAGWTVTGAAYCEDRLSWAVVVHGWDADGEPIDEADVMAVYDEIIAEVWAR